MTDISDKEAETVALLPENDSDAVAHDQSIASNDLRIETLVSRDQDGLPASSLDMELGRLAESDTKRYGIQVILQIAAAWAKENNTKFAILGNKNTKLADELTTARVEIASLEAANMERAKHRPLVNSALVLGPVIFTFGLDQLISKNWGVGIVASLIGGCIIVAALLAQRGGR